jgi:hypothetical protein
MFNECRWKRKRQASCPQRGSDCHGRKERMLSTKTLPCPIILRLRPNTTLVPCFVLRAQFFRLCGTINFTKQKTGQNQFFFYIADQLGLVSNGPVSVP